MSGANQSDLFETNSPQSSSHRGAELHMIVVTSRMSVDTGVRDAFLETIRYMLGPTRVKTGCLSFRLYKDAEDENVFYLVEKWESEEALEEHMRSENYRKFLILLDLLKEPPEVEFHTAPLKTGLDYVAEILSSRSERLQLVEGRGMTQS